MKPRRGDPPLTIIDLSTVTIGSLRETIDSTDYFGFPCVLNTDSQLLGGFLTRKDIQFVLGVWVCGGVGEAYSIEDRVCYSGLHVMVT